MCVCVLAYKVCLVKLERCVAMLLCECGALQSCFVASSQYWLDHVVNESYKAGSDCLDESCKLGSVGRYSVPPIGYVYALPVSQPYFQSLSWVVGLIILQLRVLIGLRPF